MPFSTTPYPMVQRARKSRLTNTPKLVVDERTQAALKQLARQTEERLRTLNADDMKRRQTKVVVMKDHKPIRPGKPLIRDTGEGMPKFDAPAEAVQPSGRTLGHNQGKTYVQQKAKRRAASA